MAGVASQVVSVSNGMGLAFLYESAKDVLKWNKLSVKENVKTVMDIGVLYHLSDEDFNKANLKTEGSDSMGAEAVDRLAQIMNGGSNGGNTNKR